MTNINYRPVNLLAFYKLLVYLKEISRRVVISLNVAIFRPPNEGECFCRMSHFNLLRLEHEQEDMLGEKKMLTLNCLTASSGRRRSDFPSSANVSAALRLPSHYIYAPPLAVINLSSHTKMEEANNKVPAPLK